MITIVVEIRAVISAIATLLSVVSRIESFVS